jgi:hypothetical protein
MKQISLEGNVIYVEIIKYVIFKRNSLSNATYNYKKICLKFREFQP